MYYNIFIYKFYSDSNNIYLFYILYMYTDTSLVGYGALWIISLLTFFCFLIGTNKMLKIIVSISLFIVILLWRSWFLNYLISFLMQSSDIVFLTFSHIELAVFIKSADTTTSILIFIWLLIYVVHHTNSWLDLSSPVFSSKIVQQLILVPCAIISIILWLSVALIGVDLFSVSFLQSIAISFSSTSLVYRYIFFLPMWLLLQWLFTLFVLFRRENTSSTSYDDL